MPGTPDTLIALGNEARREGRISDAGQYFSRAIALCSGPADQAMRARLLTCLGQIERDLKNTRLAIQHYMEAADIYRSLPDPLHLAHAIRHVGDILRQEGSIEKADSCYEEALTIYRQHHETPDLDLANAIRGFALLQEGIGEADLTMSLWNEAKRLYEAASVQPGVQESEMHIALLTKNQE